MLRAIQGDKLRRHGHLIRRSVYLSLPFLFCLNMIHCAADVTYSLSILTLSVLALHEALSFSAMIFPSLEALQFFYRP